LGKDHVWEKASADHHNTALRAPHGLYTGAAAVLIAVALLIGLAGYHWIAGLNWVDSFLNASMILGVMSIVLIPEIHRVMHQFHVAA
jgi:hypothetical protein